VHVEFVNGQGRKLVMKLGAQYGVELCPELESRLGSGWCRDKKNAGVFRPRRFVKFGLRELGY